MRLSSLLLRRESRLKSGGYGRMRIGLFFLFMGCFLWLTLMDREIMAKNKERWKARMAEFRQKLVVNLVLLVFPWGLFLILAPQDLLETLSLGAIYWRILGVFSLFGAMIYYFPYRLYKRKLSYYVLLFGMVDNIAAGLIITVLFALRRVPLLAWSAAPLLFYFGWFFMEQMKNWRPESGGGVG